MNKNSFRQLKAELIQTDAAISQHKTVLAHRYQAIKRRLASPLGLVSALASGFGLGLLVRRKKIATAPPQRVETPVPEKKPVREQDFLNRLLYLTSILSALLSLRQVVVKLFKQQ